MRWRGAAGQRQFFSLLLWPLDIKSSSEQLENSRVSLSGFFILLLIILALFIDNLMY